MEGLVQILLSNNFTQTFIMIHNVNVRQGKGSTNMKLSYIINLALSCGIHQEQVTLLADDSQYQSTIDTLIGRCVVNRGEGPGPAGPVLARPFFAY